MNQWWNDTYSPWGNNEDYAGKSYWIATENWPNQSYHTNKSLAANIGGFSNGFVPMFGVIGPGNEVFFIGNDEFNAVHVALRQAINAFEE